MTRSRTPTVTDFLDREPGKPAWRSTTSPVDDTYEVADEYGARGIEEALAWLQGTPTSV
jgi:hypothetical protein